MKKLAFLSLIFLTLFACRKDVEDNTGFTTSPEPPVITTIDFDQEVDPVTASLFGSVFDENGAPISGAAISLNNINTSTDENGRFVIEEETMNHEGTFVKIVKQGYFNGSYRFFPNEGSVNYVNITLLTKTNTGNFVSNDGGVVTDATGLKIEFPANSVVTSNGEVFEGTVEVAARWIDPTDSDLQSIMPGGLQGISTDVQEVALGSFGMMAVELESSTGQSLNMGNDLEATLTFPIPDELVANAPSEIPLWSFNEDYGLWVQEGTATLEGNTYVGDVSHFSFWNCDWPYPLVDLSGQILSEAGNPVVNAWVKLTIISNGYCASGWTDSEGFFEGKVPEGEEFIMTVSHYQSCEGFETNIGPFTEDTDLGVITIPTSSAVDVTGTLTDCDGNPLESGWVNVEYGNYTYTYYVEDGDINFSYFNCGEELTITVVVGDFNGLVVSDPMTFTFSESIDFGTIAACGNVLPEFLIINLEGVTSTFVDVGGGFYGPDSSYISAFNSGQQNQEYNVYLGLGDVNGVGTYDESYLTWGSMYLPGDAGNEYFLQCGNNPANPGSCGTIEIVITEFGNVGEDVIGTFTGESEFTDNTGATATLPYSGSFKVIRD